MSQKIVVLLVNATIVAQWQSATPIHSFRLLIVNQEGLEIAICLAPLAQVGQTTI